MIDKCWKTDWRRCWIVPVIAVVLISAACAQQPAPLPTFLDKTTSDRMGPQNEPVETGKYERLLHVRKDGSDETGDGSKEKPLATLGGALAKIADAKADNTCAVLIAAGKYDVKDLPLRPYVHLFGGFDPSSWQRDIFKNETTLAPQEGGRVAIGANNARLDGFIITGARFRGHGGAILCDDTSPEITNNVFRENMTLQPVDFRHDRIHQSGNDGGAIAVFYKAGPRIANNLFVGNRTDVGGGGAISCRGEQRIPDGPIAMITRNVFIDNVSGIGDKGAPLPTRSSNGGAIQCSQRAPARIIHNVFVRNRAEGLGDGGALYIERDANPLVAGNWFVGGRCGDDGGAIYAFKNCLPVISGNYFAGNDCLRGGPGGVRLSHQGAALIHNNVFSHNYKGGIDSASAWMKLTHNTSADNFGFGVGYRSHGGEGYRGKPVYFVPAEITHNIIYGNQAEEQLEADQSYDMPKPIANNNLIQGGYEGSGNLDKDPMFVEDALAGSLSGVEFDPKWQITTLTVQGAQLETNTLAGRVIQVGGQFGVVRSNEAGRIAVWGDMTKPLAPTETPETGRKYPERKPQLDAKQFKVLSTYQLKPGSPAQGLGWTTPAPAREEPKEKDQPRRNRRRDRRSSQSAGENNANVALAVKEENFDKDPGWDAFNNRLKPDANDIRTVVQDFGYSATNFAGGQKGEIGGQVWRCTTPAYYADRIAVKTLNDKLTASGKFSFTSTQGGAGFWFGWFSSQQEAGNVRPMGGLGLNFDFESDGGRLAVRMSNDKNKFCGTFVTPYIPGKFRPAPLSPNTTYEWTLKYDPAGNGGDGQFQFTIKSVGIGAEAQKKYAEMNARASELPTDLRSQFDGRKVGRPDFDGGKPFIVDLPPGFKKEGASFDRFGLMNTVKEGDAVKIYFDDLQHDGKTHDFSTDPQWEGLSNRAQLQESTPTGFHDVGFSAATNFAGGSPGEMTGTFWRLTKAYGYYADRIGPLTLDDPLEASGKLMLKLGTPDSEMAFGWFNSSQREIPQERMKQEGHLDKTDNFLGVYLAGPSRLGRCMLPSVVTAKGTKVVFKEVDESPKPAPGQIYDWRLKYDPAAQGGKGVFTVTLGKQSATLVVDEKLRAEGATFDRFGFFPSGGGGMVQISFDDLKYTARRR